MASSCLAFDYRGWGESDGKLVVKAGMPDPDANGEVTVRAQEIRTVVDPIDQTLDIRRAFDYIEGEPGVDISRLGYWGPSYSGAHAIWVAAHEPRAACAVGQVAAADSLDLARTSWKGEDIDIDAHAHQQAVRRARGDIDPLPQSTDKAPNLRGWAHLDKVIGYRPVDDADRITIPLLVIDARRRGALRPAYRGGACGHTGTRQRRTARVPCYSRHHALPDLSRSVRGSESNGGRMVQRVLEGLSLSATPPRLPRRLSDPLV